MKQCYIPKNFQAETLQLIQRITGIVDDYKSQGYVLTVRQLYYQLVAKDIIPNTLQEYKRVASIINDAKHAGLLDWDMIEDRTREFIRRPSWENGAQIMQAAASSFHMDMWEHQTFRLFVVIEKEALVGVLENVCKKYDVPILAARGYPSGSVLREFAQTDLIPALQGGQKPVILHLGDHDPSGIDMTRDLQERLNMYSEEDIQLERLALNMPQVEELNPPENPAKVTDSRFIKYQDLYGVSSWELDALPPSYLNSLVAEQISMYIDDDAWADRRDEIEDIRTRLQTTAENFR